MSQAEIIEINDVTDFSKMREEKEKFIEGILLRQANLTEDFITSSIEKKIVTDFIKKINVAKLNERHSGEIRGDKIFNVILEVANTDIIFMV